MVREIPQDIKEGVMAKYAASAQDVTLGRRRAPLSQNALARDAGISRASVGRILGGVELRGPALGQSAEPAGYADVVSFLTEEIAAVQAGTQSRITPYPQVARRFHISVPTVGRIVRDNALQEALQEARREARRNPVPETITYSEGTAWVMGLMAAHGQQFSRSKTTGRIILTPGDPRIFEEAKLRGERVFDTEPVETMIKGHSHPSLVFHTKKAPAFEKFSVTKWPKTLRERHHEILDNERLLREFVSAYIDVRGRISLEPRQRHLTVAITVPQAADMVMEIMARLGVENARLITDASKRGGVNGVGIYNRKDLKRLASVIHSVNPVKEAQLQQLRELDAPPTRDRPGDIYP